MRFTVFGGQGFIGGELARHLRAGGHVVDAGGDRRAEPCRP